MGERPSRCVNTEPALLETMEPGPADGLRSTRTLRRAAHRTASRLRRHSSLSESSHLLGQRLTPMNAKDWPLPGNGAPILWPKG
jgi:hypothetical protein